MIAVILSRQAGSREATERRRTVKDLKLRMLRRSHAVSAQVAHLEILRPRFAGLRMTSVGRRGGSMIHGRQMLNVECSMLNVECRGKHVLVAVAKPSFNIEHSTFNIEHSLLTLREVRNA
jgi:hypothetical protein